MPRKSNSKQATTTEQLREIAEDLEDFVENGDSRHSVTDPDHVLPEDDVATDLEAGELFMDTDVSLDAPVPDLGRVNLENRRFNTLFAGNRQIDNPLVFFKPSDPIVLEYSADEL